VLFISGLDWEKRGIGMIEKIKPDRRTPMRYKLVCSYCGKEFGIYDSFDEAVCAKRDKKITTVKTEYGNWEDYCCKCFEKYYMED
jgi:hypothetical protein